MFSALVRTVSKGRNRLVACRRQVICGRGGLHGAAGRGSVGACELGEVPPPAPRITRAHNAGPGNSANPANSASAGDAGLTGNLGTIYTGASETGTFARLNDDGAQFKGSGSKEDYYDFGLNYGGDRLISSTSDGLVRHRHRKGERKKRRAGAVVAAIVAVVLVALGASGFMLLNSAKTVKSQAKETVEIVGGLKDKVTSGDFSTLPDDAKKIDELCNSMKAGDLGPAVDGGFVYPGVWRRHQCCPHHGRRPVRCFERCAGPHGR